MAVAPVTESVSRAVEAHPRKLAQAVKRIDQRALRIEQMLALTVVVLPFLGLVAAVAWGWQRGVGWPELTLFASTYLLTGFGVTVGYHRLFTHKSFEAPNWVRAGFAIAGSMALQGPVVRWVADHRRHHAYSDKPGDPHSPNLEDDSGVAALLRGLWHAHIGWFFAPEKTRVRKFAPDLLEDRLITTIDRYYLVWVVLSLALPTLAGWLWLGGSEGAISGLLWGGLVRAFFVHHVTWSINSVCHTFGARPFATRDSSTNNVWLALPSLGEAWHNAHHAFPTSATHGLGRFEIDLSSMLIRALELVGLARNVKRPTAAQIASKRAS